jgi:hypothetical protein
MPVGNHEAVLWLFILNRVLSGAAEACASGADEALAYDSLPAAERPMLWPKVMSKLSRAMAVGFIISSISGSVLYDHSNVTALLGWIGLSGVDRAVTMKIPLMLNFLTGLACLLVCLRMTEVSAAGDSPKAKGHWLTRSREAFCGMVETACWVWSTPAAVTILLLGVVFDSVIRLFLTVASNFYRLVGIEEAWYGVIGTVVSMLGLITAGLMERCSERWSLLRNFTWLAVVVFASLQAAAHPQAGWLGVALIMPLMLGMRFLHFFLSHYLNAVVDSSRRATALSFRGLTMNLAYGVMTLLFGWHTHWISHQLQLPAEDSRVFAASLTWWPWWFAGTLGAALLFMRLRRR